MKDYFIVLTQDLTSADGKRIYEVTTSDKIPVDAYFPSDYADEVSITENKATVVFVIGSVKDSQTIVLKLNVKKQQPPRTNFREAVVFYW